MKAVKMCDGYYYVLVPEARVTLVLTQEEFVIGLKRAKSWKRRRVQAEREAEAAVVADEKRARLAQERRSSPDEW
jgi:hypothetical protein